MNEIIEKKIIIATKRLFSTTFNVEVAEKEPFTVNDPTDDVWDISGIISITGAYSGLIAVRFKDKLPVALIKSSPIKKISRDFHEKLMNDMVGEVTNIIAGNAFSDVEDGDIMLSIPVTVQGENHSIGWSMQPEIRVFPFSCLSQNFVVEAEIKKITG